MEYIHAICSFANIHAMLIVHSFLKYPAQPSAFTRQDSKVYEDPRE